MREYVVEQGDGEQLMWVTTRWRELIRAVPRVRDGTITLDGRVYVVDPRRFRRRYDWRTLHLGKREVQVQFWKENDPEPVPFFDDDPDKDRGDFTGTVIATLGRSERLRRLVMPETNWLLILLLMSIVGNIALAIVIYNATRGG